MAGRFIDGFDHYPAAEMLHKWSSWSNTVSFVTGRFGGSALSTASRSVTKVLDNQAEWIIGFGFQHLGVSTATGPFLRFMAGATIQDDLYWDASALKLSVRRGGSTVLGTTTLQLNANVWYYVELRLVFNDTTGVVQLRVNGVQDINLSSQDTNNAGGNVADRIQFGDPGASNINVSIDDLYLNDATGSAPMNTFLGDCRVETIYPNGNGNSSQLVGQDADSTDNYLNVDETNSDDDTTYNESSTVGNKDTYAYGNLAVTSGTVYAVQILPWARKTDAGTRSIVTVARLAGTEVDSSAYSLPDTYTYVGQNIRETKPGGGAWTISDVNSAEFGVKINA
jgi:hypothetical protein